MTSGSSSVPATGAPPGSAGGLRHCFVRGASDHTRCVRESTKGPGGDAARILLVQQNSSPELWTRGRLCPFLCSVDHFEWSPCVPVDVRRRSCGGRPHPRIPPAAGPSGPSSAPSAAPRTAPPSSSRTAAPAPSNGPRSAAPPPRCPSMRT
ncbi:hypothetical protein GZL_04136 [Streptomyces sp. 769]|nr:hypothetical protein GZL_04136 [Streptomyces sp. 769]